MHPISSSPIVTHSWSGLATETYSGRSSSLQIDPFGTYRLVSSAADDFIRVRQECRSGERWLCVDVNGDHYRIPLTGPRAARSFAIDARRGNDAVFVDANVTLPLFIRGGEGDDFLKGGSGPNALLGGPGRDTLVGGPSDDLLLGGPDEDVIHTCGGCDSVSVQGLYRRLHDGWRCGPREARVEDEGSRLSWGGLEPKAWSPLIKLPQRQPVSTPLVPWPVPTPIPSQRQPQRVVPPPSRPYVMPRPRLTDLLAAVETYDEKGFKSGQGMAKQLLTALLQGNSAFRQALASITGQGERDDAVACFLRALLDAGPGGARLLRGITAADKKVLGDYLGSGNCWNAQKKGLMLLISKASGVWDHNFGTDPQAIDYMRRYEGVL